MLKNPKVLKRGFTCWSTETWHTRGNSLNYVTHKGKALRVCIVQANILNEWVWARVTNDGPVYCAWIKKSTLTLQKPRDSK